MQVCAATWPCPTTFFDVSLDMLCIRDMEGRFVKLSRSWETTLGYSIDELLGAPLLPLVHPDDVPATHDLMQRIVVENEIVGFINRYRHRDGGYRSLEWRARRSGDRVFAVARDVTERLANEAEIKAAKQAAEAANRSKSDFLANMSHEIRTPLNGVIGVVASLARTELTPDQLQMVELIESAGMTLERLVSDILDVSKIEAGLLSIEARAFDLDELRSVLEIHRMRAQDKGLAFDVVFGEAARGEFLGDSLRIKQLLGNLLSNAVKFTGQGGVAVRIDVLDRPDGPSVVEFEVSDTGVGFDAAAGADLFQRFNQADTTITRRFGGTGLGLAICKSLVGMMGGEIGAESEPGHGSRFRAVLPLARSRALADYDLWRASRSTQAAEATADFADTLRVLLAEDHPINQRVVQLILAPYDAQVTTVVDGAQALDAFRAETFDLVLMDMQMPVMDGLTATRAIREHEAALAQTRRTPIVILSANAMREHRLDALAAGADLHIAKPVTASALISGITEALQMAASTAPDREAG